jgi:hypothetical protein
MVLASRPSGYLELDAAWNLSHLTAQGSISRAEAWTERSVDFGFAALLTFLVPAGHCRMGRGSTCALEQQATPIERVHYLGRGLRSR